MSITSEQAHATFRDFKQKEDSEIVAGKSVVISDTLGIEVDGFRFEVSAKITPAQVRLAGDVPDDPQSYSEIARVYAKFMASVAVHPDMKTPEFWIDYDNETGYLPDIVNYVLSNTERLSPVIKKFR